MFGSLEGIAGFNITNAAPFVGLNTAGTIKINGVDLLNNTTSGVTGSLIEVRNGGRVRVP